ncbi:MAG: helix-turn-helix transcriptional regulator [Solirubrobacterales bacterium]|nr:helix-turn-helix transcriptional regulator [Solirubrobacterales bacterium]
MNRLKPAAYESILDVLREASVAQSTRPFTEEVAEALRRALGCEAVAYYEWTERDGILDSSVVPDDRADRVSAWQLYPLFRFEDPLPGCHRRPDLPNPPPDPAIVGRPLAFQDCISERRFRQTGLYNAVCRPFAVRDVLKLFLPCEQPERAASFVFDTSRARFTEQDKEVLRRLLPFLIQVRRNARLRSAVASASNRLALLTPRETVVLGRVAHGDTNRQIATALFVAPTTVRRHLEHIFEKLEVRNRAAATAVYASARDSTTS